MKHDENIDKNKINKNVIFTLGRIIDPTYPTNKVILIISFISLISGIIQHFFREKIILNALVYGFSITLIVFFTWAIAREMYPQEEYTALLASIICFLGLLWVMVTPIIILMLVWFTIILRLINQTTGISPSILDRTIIFVFTLIVSSLFSWILLVLMVLVFYVDFILSKRRSSILFIILGVGALIFFILFQGFLYQYNPPNVFYSVIVSLAIVLYISFMWMVRTITVLGDQSNKMVPAQRIISAQLLGGIFIGLFTIWFGIENIVLLIPLWSVLLSSIISAPIVFFIKQKN